MTRINLVPPAELHTKHLVAEYRELPRIFGQSRAAYERGDTRPFPPEYTLGPGHVRFFYNKLYFLRLRFHYLVVEMLSRGYKPQHQWPPTCEWAGMELMQDYIPTPEALALNRERIALRYPKG